MWVFVAEAMGALGLLLLIVWWTLGPTHRREQAELRRLIDEEATGDADRVSSKAEPAARER